MWEIRSWKVLCAFKMEMAIPEYVFPSTFLFTLQCQGKAWLQEAVRDAGRHVNHAQLPSSQDRLCLGTSLLEST